MNSIIYFEILANGLQEVMESYKNVFGWNVQLGLLQEDAYACK